jgi:hypothetical protein
MLRMGMAGLLAAAVLLGGVGCGGGDGDDDAGSGDELRLELAEQNGSEQEGTATFTPLGVGRTRIVMELTNPPDVSQPAHVHSGSCDDLGDPVIALSNVEDGRSETEASVSIEQLVEDEVVIHAHKSEAEYDVSVACAPIEQSAP